jgi:hypothetical protein
MLAKISILTSMIFAVLYPLCFWISYKDPLKNNFHKFHLGLPNVVGGITLVFILLSDIPWSIKWTVIFWKAALLTVSRYSWKKEFPKAPLITIPCILGLVAFYRVQAHWVEPGFPLAFAGILGGLILCASVFAMNLGHWYLNVHGLPLSHLQRANNCLWIFLVMRAVWDLAFMLNGTVLYGGDFLPLTSFITKLDGFLLSVALFFGTVFPIAALLFVRGTLKVKNTQSATGILYVVLCSILIGDLTYKYYAVKYGIFL